jgi:hypothetical protein
MSLPEIPSDTLEYAAALLWRQKLDTVDIKDRLNSAGRWLPVTEAEVAAALARALDRRHSTREAA